MMPGKTNNIEMTVPVTTYDLQYYIYPEKVGSLGEIPDDIKKLYLVDDEKYQVNHPVIQKALKEALGDEKNPYWITRKFFNYVISHLFYEMTGGWNTAPTVLARGNGSCSEYSFVYISLCRAAGIPARYVGSVHRSAEVHYDDSFHRWIEIYLPKYGWIPVDPTIGDSSNPRDQAHAFGFVGYNFFITTQSGGGSEFLGWSYNSNERYSTEPKTFVSVDFWADWQKSE
jgi:transglutaminase-like putative cysteine protease